MTTQTALRIELLPEEKTARFERMLILPPIDGKARERIMEEKIVDASVLFGSRGGFACLPRQCRFHAHNDTRELFVIEEPPSVCNVSWHTDAEPYKQIRSRLLTTPGMSLLWGESTSEFEARIRTQKRFTIALPYIVFVIAFDNGHFGHARLYFRTEALSSIDDGLLVPNLPNRYIETHLLCLTNEAKQLDLSMGLTYADLVERVCDIFWASAWSADWCHEFLNDAERMPDVASPWEWERMTEIDPNFVLSLPWREYDENLRDIVEKDVPSVRTGQIFDVLQQRVLSADHWDHVPAAFAHGDVRVSPSTSVSAGLHILHVDDRVHLDPDAFDECSGGGTFAIKWFGMPEQGSRFVGLDGIDDPILLICAHELAAGVQIVSTVAPDTIELQGIAIEPMTLIRFTDRDEWPSETNCWQHVVAARRDPSGSVLVQLHGRGTFMPISEGDAPYPGVTLAPIEEVDTKGHLVAQQVELGDGTVVHVGDRFFNVHQMVSFKIFALHALRRGEHQRCASTSRNPRKLLESSQGKINEDIVPMPVEPLTTLVVGERTISVGDMVEHIFDRAPITELTPLFPNGIVYALFERTGWFTLMENEKPAQNVRFLPTCQVEEDGSA
ncbi:MAG: hypothetical protein ABIG71_00415, partial [Candidatus Uhrbacteria bacterium]